MPKSTDAVLLALIATLEQRAQTKGKKSIVKGVVARLADAEANPALIAEIAALRKKNNGHAPAPDQTEASKAEASKTAKPKAAGPKAVAPEAPTVPGQP
jgi:hypothetical protein